MKTRGIKLMVLSLTFGLSSSLVACSGQMDESLKQEIQNKVENSSDNLSEKLVASTSVSAMGDDTNIPTVCVPEAGIISGGSISINDGAAETSSPIAVLSLGGLEETLRMKISNDGNCECGSWEFYSPTKQWALEPVDGVATVAVQYKDYEGRVSKCVKSTIRFNVPNTTTTTTLPPETTTTTLPPETTTTTLPPIVTTTTLPPIVTTTTLPPVVVTTTTQPGHYVDQIYNVEAGNKKIDILIVDDNSVSMKYEQRSMAKRMSNFLKQLKGLDWRVAITTTDPEHSLFGDGRLVEMKGLSGQYYITSAMDHNMAQKILGETVQRSERGHVLEQGIYVTYRAIERSLGIGLSTSCKKDLFSSHRKYKECLRKEKNPNYQFFRKDASLAVIVISDENESGRATKNKPENLLKFVNETFPNKLFNFHSIVTRTNDIACFNGHGKTYGKTYEKMSELTGHGTDGGSIIGSVCADDYGSQLSGISDSCQKMQKVIQLKCAPIGNANNSVDVRLNGQAYGEDFQVQGDRLVFKNYLPPGSYNLQYRCQ